MVDSKLSEKWASMWAPDLRSEMRHEYAQSCYILPLCLSFLACFQSFVVRPSERRSPSLYLTVLLAAYCRTRWPSKHSRIPAVIAALSAAAKSHSSTPVHQVVASQHRAPLPPFSSPPSRKPGPEGRGSWVVLCIWCLPFILQVKGNLDGDMLSVCACVCKCLCARI